MLGMSYPRWNSPLPTYLGRGTGVGVAVGGKKISRVGSGIQGTVVGTGVDLTNGVGTFVASGRSLGTGAGVSVGLTNGLGVAEGGVVSFSLTATLWLDTISI